VNEGALLAARRNRDMVFMADLEDAKDKVMLGAERRSLVMREEERRLTGLPRGGPRGVRAQDPGQRPAPQADHRAARAVRWAWPSRCRRTTASP
jgi:cell division protease FtsH